MKNKLIYLIFGIILMISLINAYQLNQPITLIQTCNNCSYCSATAYYPNSTLFLNNVSMIKSGTNYNYLINGGNISVLGNYEWDYTCGNSNEIATGKLNFNITTTGNDASLTSIVFYIAGLSLIIVFLGFCIFFFMKFDNLINRAGMLGVSYILLIALSYMAYQMCLDFLTKTSFLATMFFYLWMVLMYASILIFPAGFLWFLYQIGKIKEIQGLVNKGISEDEAEHRVKSRRKYGK